MVALVPMGAASINFISTATTHLQLTAEPAMRGRVMALWAVSIMGTTPVGGPLVGWVGETFGARTATKGGGASKR